MSFSDKTASIFKRDIFLKIWTIFTGIIIARILGSVNMGLWYILLMIPNYAEPFGRLKMDVASVYFVRSGKYRLGEVYFNLVMVSLLSSILILGLLFWQRNFILLNIFKGMMDAKSLVYIMFLYIPLNFITINYSYLFLSREDIKAFNALAIIGPLVASILSLFLLFVLKWGLFSLVISQIVSGFLSIFYGAWKLSQTDRMVCCLNKGMLKDFFNFGWKLYLGGIFSHLQVYVAGLLVAMYLLPSDVTFFKMGQDKALLLTSVSGAIGTILYPLVARNHVDAEHVSAKACRMTILLLSILAGIGVIIINPMVYFLYGKEFLPQVAPFLIMLPGVVLLSGGNVLLQHFMGKGNPGLILKISLVPLVLQILLCVLLMPIFGLLGAASATSFTYLLTGIITVAIFSKHTKLRIDTIIIPTRQDIILLNNFIKTQMLKYIKLKF